MTDKMQEQKPVYDVDYFISKFSAIPEDKWTTGCLKDNRTGACCALGHCNADYSYTALGADSSVEANNLRRIFKVKQLEVPEVNDDMSGLYNHLGTTPKARIIAVLEDIKRSGTV